MNQFRCRSVLLLLLSAASVSSAPPPSLHISREGSDAKIIFYGTLQRAESVTGPWTNLVEASSPHVEAGGSPKFYRAREPVSIFAAVTPVEFKISGPLQAHFEKAFAGMPDGIFPPVREKPWFEGELEFPGLVLPVELRVRGNSSLQECPFPKLKFKVSRDNRAGTPFFDAREIKIGTHCAEGGRGPIGRLREEKATYREALAYEVMQIVGFVGPRVRRGQVEYQDTTPPNGVSEVGWTMTRQALLLEDAEVIAGRLGGRALDDEEISALTNTNFEVQLVTDIWIFHVLLGNWDYVLPFDGKGMWNTEVIELPGGKLMPIPGDFDLCSWVTEQVRLDAPWDYRPELPDLERQAHYKLNELRKLTTAEAFAASRARFLEKRAAISAHVSTALVDAEGRTNAVQHIAAFYEALEAAGRK